MTSKYDDLIEEAIKSNECPHGCSCGTEKNSKWRITVYVLIFLGVVTLFVL